MTQHHLPEIDVYRAAQMTINRHGERAILVAMEKIENFRQNNNDGGAAVWRQIADKIEWLQMPGCITGETTH